MSFKTLDLANDVASLVSAINEVVTISSSLYSSDANVKRFSNIAYTGTPLGGYWQTIYDANPTSSLSTALLDLSYGYTTGSWYNVPGSAVACQAEKAKVYSEFASVLLGDKDAQFSINSTPVTECFFVAIKRNIAKDEIKKGATSVDGNSDAGAATNFKQTVGGDYAPLLYNGTGSEMGQVWYNAGVIVLPASDWFDAVTWSGSLTLGQAQQSGSIDQLCDGFRNHGSSLISFHNQTNMYSTAYFCHANAYEFNYSSNPTFVDDNKRIRVTSGSNVLTTRTYVTTIGLYDVNDNLLAVAKVNKPITKSNDIATIFRIRLDY